jgi:hypothetical protein
VAYGVLEVVMVAMGEVKQHRIASECVVDKLNPVAGLRQTLSSCQSPLLEVLGDSTDSP